MVMAMYKMQSQLQRCNDVLSLIVLLSFFSVNAFFQCYFLRFINNISYSSALPTEHTVFLCGLLLMSKKYALEPYGKDKRQNYIKLNVLTCTSCFNFFEDAEVLKFINENQMEV